MKLSQLADRYHDFAKFTFTIVIDGVTLPMGEEVSVTSFQIELSNGLAANTCNIQMQVMNQQLHLLKMLQTGAKIKLSGGYQKEEELIFQGYIHMISFHGRRRAFIEEIELYAQDVKGLMMQHKQLQFQKGKKKSTVLAAIVQDAFYKQYIDKVVIDKIDACMDNDLYSTGKSDYDMLCNLCDDLFFTCYVAADTLYVTRNHKSNKTCMCMDCDTTYQQITQEVCLHEQYGSIVVRSSDGYQTKKQVTMKTTPSKLQGKNLSSVMKHATLTLVDQGYHQIEELNYVASAVKKEIEHRYATIKGKNLFLPQLMCGRNIEVVDYADQQCKKAMIFHILHQYDEDGFTSEWEATL